MLNGPLLGQVLHSLFIFNAHDEALKCSRSCWGYMLAAEFRVNAGKMYLCTIVNMRI